MYSLVFVFIVCCLIVQKTGTLDEEFAKFNSHEMLASIMISLLCSLLCVLLLLFFVCFLLLLFNCVFVFVIYCLTTKDWYPR